MLVLAHRGLSAHYPENTQIAFEKSIEQGAKAIECDVHQLANEFIIYHDFSFKRMTGQDLTLHDLDSQAETGLELFKRLRVQGAHKIMNLHECLQVIDGRVLLNLEIKSLREPANFVKTLLCATRQYPCNIVLSSFNHPLLKQLQNEMRQVNFDSEVQFAALVAHLPIDSAQFAVDLNTDIAAIDAHLLDANFVNHAHKHGLQVWCYTVNDEHLLEKLYKYGVDGIFSDDVAWANALVKRIEKT
ncbi:glycerophosphodiester phosphodiesterase [Ningiella sp. W23]|uniref:glycerophosphodiester phosphodiesterase n=1 Tax=Ningiella sp. W23 TaxID=3023715 RepID=UPI00375737A5